VSDPELVNPVPVDDARAWVATLATALLGTPYDDDFARRVDRWSKEWLPERTWAYRDHGRLIATLATEPRNVAVPGPHGTTCDVLADALTGVSVAATHRRRGLLRSMITRSLQAAKDRGDAFSMLLAAEWPIYGRFGYAPAVMNAEYVYHPRRSSATLPAPPPGSVRQVEAPEVAAVAPGIFEVARRLRPGQVDRRHPWWDRRTAVNGYQPIGKQPHWILHEGPDGPDGLLAWKVSRDFDLNGHLGAIEIDEFVTANDTAYRDLWAYLGGIDAIDEIKLDNASTFEPVHWLLPDARALEQVSSWDSLWVRLLDVPAALSGRAYAIPGRVVLDVVDEELGGYGAGRVVLDADEDGAQCTPTTETADLRVGQRALAACYLGGYRLRQLPTGVEELTPGALERADLMFSVPLPPWNQTGF
jgi:predicted acetyltransferase